jgi:hypothetical protein
LKKHKSEKNEIGLKNKQSNFKSTHLRGLTFFRCVILSMIWMVLLTRDKLSDGASSYSHPLQVVKHFQVKPTNWNTSPKLSVLLQFLWINNFNCMIHLSYFIVWLNVFCGCLETIKLTQIVILIWSIAIWFRHAISYILILKILNILLDFFRECDWFTLVIFWFFWHVTQKEVNQYKKNRLNVDEIFDQFFSISTRALSAKQNSHFESVWKQQQNDKTK